MTTMTLEQVRMILEAAIGERVGITPNTTKMLFDAIDAYLAKDAQVQDGALGYFAADPAEGEFQTFRTLLEAREKAETLLEWASDSAADWGWADDPPQICYGVVLGGCEEESREPAPEGSEFKEMVSFRVFGPGESSLPAAPMLSQRGEVEGG